jgi:hypothetical protein
MRTLWQQRRTTKTATGIPFLFNPLGIMMQRGLCSLTILPNFPRQDRDLSGRYLPASTDIFNLNNKNVGVNTAVPTQKLDVIGEVRTNTASRAKKICSKTQPTKCFDIYKIQVWSSCPLSNQVMTGFSNGSPVCVTPVFAPPIDTDCGAGWVNGINIDGSVICIP